MASLPTRKLGKFGPEVTAMGLGLMGLSTFYGAIDADEERFKLLDRSYELGCRFWDSSDRYGDSEDLIGKWFKRTEKRDQIFLATKFGYTQSRAIRSDPEYVRQACESSLKRLGTSYIDLYYCHRVDGKTPIEKTVEAMVQLKKEGKIHYIGLSEISAGTLYRASKVHHIDAVQIEYSPFSLDIESPQIGLLKACRELGVAVVGYSPLGRGFLTGTIKSPADLEDGDGRKTILPRFSEENFPKNLVLAEQLEELARQKNVTPSQLVLAWILAQGNDIIPIPGTKKIKYLEENLHALTITLTPEETTEIRKKVEAADVHGLRYPASMAPFLLADTPALHE